MLTDNGGSWFWLPDNGNSGSIKKALHLLTSMVEQNGSTGVRKLAIVTGMAPSTTHRILKELEVNGFVQSKDGSYSIGAEMYYLASLIQSHNPLYVVGMPLLKELAKESGETLALGQYFAASNTLTFIGTIESSHPIRHVLEIGKQEALYVGAHGKAVLAFLPEEVQERVIKQAVGKSTVMGIAVKPSKLRAELTEIKRNRYAISYQETIPTAYGFCAPVIGPEGMVLGGVGLTIPDSRVNISENDEIARKVLSCANKISIALGGK